MATQRFLGGAWASVHGPPEPTALLTWVLDLDFAGLGVAPGPRAVPWEAIRAAQADLPVSLAAVRATGVLEVPSTSGDGSLASTHKGEREMAHVRIVEAARLAHRLGCVRLVLDPGTVRLMDADGRDDLGDPAVSWTEEQAKILSARRTSALDAALDAACRSLYELARAFPDLQLCLTGSRHAAGLGEPTGLAHIFDDLGPSRVHYWHDAAVAARRDEVFGTPQGEWLELFGNRMQGMTLGDSVDGLMYLPPGAGGVDYPLLSSYRRRFGRPIPAVVELDPSVEPSEIPGVHAFLSKYGL